PLGTHVITETIAPAGYALDDDATRSVTVTSGALAQVIGIQGQDDPGNTDESDFHNRLGSVAWEKRTDVTPFPLQGGATFRITPNPFTGVGFLDVVDDDLNDADPTDGQFLINNVLLGTYTVTEIAAPTGFGLDNDTTREVTVSESELNPVIGIQDQDDPGDTDESDFHNPRTPGVIVIGPDKMNCSLPFIHVVDAETGEISARFLAYEIDYLGGVRVATGDLTGDGIAEIITAPGRSHAPLIRIWDQTGALLTEFLAFSGSFIGGVDIAIGDVTGDGLNDIAAAQNFLGNQVTVFRNTTVVPATVPTFSVLGSFTPFGSFQGGSTVELADMGNTSGAAPGFDQTSFTQQRAEVIVGTEAGTAPVVKVFAYFGAATTPTLVKTFNPFTPAFHGGLSLDVARIDADLVPDIIVGAGNGGGSQVQILNGVTGAIISSFPTFLDSPSFNAPVDVAAVDENGDGVAEFILAAQGSDGTAMEIRKFNALSGALVSFITEAQFDSTFNGMQIDDFCGAYFIAPLVNTPLPTVEVQIASAGLTASLLPYGPTYFGGVSVATGDLNGDGIEEIVTGPERNYAPWVRIFDQAGNLLNQFLAYSGTFKGGVDVAVGDVNGDGKLDIATSMLSGGSQVKTFKNVIPLAAAVLPKTSFSAYSSFYPFGSSFKGGAVVELANLGKAVTVGGVKKLDSKQFDSRSEVVVANGSGLRSTVKAYSYFGTSTTATLVRTFLPFNSTFKGGLSLDVARIDGDLVPDIIVGAGKGGGSNVQVLNGLNGAVISAFQAFTVNDSPDYNAKLDVEAQDADQDGIAEFLLAARDYDGKSREIRRFYSLTGELVDSFFENYSSI
ncbi:MAG: FG-GAP-like repeat-containing protein, partial [Planctomycetaceae bacterium]|nr:FG-GAP-like repeat-containing protein [Planctomycetaceae bacterium]